jgi:hypothetical protein
MDFFCWAFYDSSGLRQWVEWRYRWKFSSLLAVWSGAEDFSTQLALPRQGRWRMPAGVSFPRVG